MMTAELRLLLTRFVEHHPEAEKQVSRLILKHLGINKSSVWGPRTASDISASSDGADSDLSSPIPLYHSDGADIVPAMSPVPWLSEDSWRSMSSDEKIGFMEHITNGAFRSEHKFVHSKYFPTGEY